MEAHFFSGHSKRVSKRLANNFTPQDDDDDKCKRDCNPTGPPNGCFAEGTQILMAGGGLKKIEELKIYDQKTKEGDKVMTLGGKEAHVVDLIYGPEDIPIVWITVKVFDGSKDKQLTMGLTEKHPVLVRYNYLVQANWLEVNDQVHTMWGPGIITKVERKNTEKDVWNLVVSSDEFVESKTYGDRLYRYAFSSNSLLGLSPKDHVVFANGTALATWSIQTQMAAMLKNGINLKEFN